MNTKTLFIPKFINTSSPPTGRIASVDQCRGLCILLMVGGNFAGKFAFMPWILTHHKYGLTIAEIFGPVFFLMVGFGYRLSFLRRQETLGTRAAAQSAVRRYVFILLIGFVVYFGHFWDALTHIGMAGLLLLPVVGRAWRVRCAVAVLFLGMYQFLYHYTGYGAWLMGHDYSLNGGPLAVLSWGFIILCGTLVHDAWALREKQTMTHILPVLGIGLICSGWLLSLPWPGVKESWPYTRYGMTLPFPVTTAGAAIMIYLFFYWYCDLRGRRLPFVSPIGANPILMYAIMGAFIGGSKLLIQFRGEPEFHTALAAYIGICAVCYAVASVLYNKNISLRIS